MTSARSGWTTLAAIGACGLLPGLAFAQRLGGGAPETTIAWWRVISALVVCLALAIGGAYALRSRMRGAAPLLPADERRLRLLETMRIGHQVDICLIGCGEHQVLVAASPQGVVLLKSDASAAGDSP
ncbi:MAG TPA: flagellar biosynthetic protein FliO [Caulobacteraceae bacterium]|jgi:flagellar biogenesis protein FliO